MARQAGVTLLGPPPGEVIPEITRAEFVAGMHALYEVTETQLSFAGLEPPSVLN